jgi:hypothetical protein
MEKTLKERAITLIDGLWSLIEENHRLSYHFICMPNSDKLLLAIKEHLKYEQIECLLSKVEETEEGFSLILESYNETIKIDTHSAQCIEVKRGSNEFMIFMR